MEKIGGRSLECEDILFGMIDESMRKIEPIILRFEREAQALNNLSLNLSHYEKLDYVRRSHMAKDVMNQFQSDLEIKQQFFISLRKKDFISQKMRVSNLISKIYNIDVIDVMEWDKIDYCIYCLIFMSHLVIN